MCEIDKTIKKIMKRIILISLFFFGVGAELVSINYLLINRITINIYELLFVHIIGSILISLSITYILNPLHEKCRLNYFLFSLVMLSFIPFLGVFVLIVVFTSKKSGAVNQHTEIVNAPLSQIKIGNLSLKQINENSGYVVSTNSITYILTSKNSIPEERQKAVLDTMKLPDKEAIPLLRKALKDNEDDVRLLAYALIKRKENTVTSRLQNRLRLVNEASESTPVFIHKAIAYDCWEIIYLDLMQGEVQNYYLDIAIKHIKILLRDNDPDPGLKLLFAKILMRKGEFVQSREYFIKAAMTGIDKNRLLPYFAEIAFLEKRFCNISEFINNTSKDNSSYKMSRLTEILSDT
jgi:hypothetical protein